jgi:hypothetical protein
MLNYIGYLLTNDAVFKRNRQHWLCQFLKKFNGVFDQQALDALIQGATN